MLSSSSPSHSTCVWAFITISIALKRKFSNLCLDYVICANNFCSVVCAFMFTLCCLVHVLQVIPYFVVLKFFLHSSCAMLKCFVEMFYSLRSTFCVLCSIETLIALAFSLYWNGYCSSILILLKYFLLWCFHSLEVCVVLLKHFTLWCSCFMFCEMLYYNISHFGNHV